MHLVDDPVLVPELRLVVVQRPELHREAEALHDEQRVRGGLEHRDQYNTNKRHNNNTTTNNNNSNDNICVYTYMYIQREREMYIIMCICI